MTHEVTVTPRAPLKHHRKWVDAPLDELPEPGWCVQLRLPGDELIDAIACDEMTFNK